MYCNSILRAMVVVVFSVCVTAPGVATNPFPADDATDVDVDVVLTWTSGGTAASYDIYFGDSEAYVGFYQRLDGDINGDGPVNVSDLMVLAQQWLGAPTEPYADLDGDGNVNLADLAAVSNEWLDSAHSFFMGNQTATSYDPGPLQEGQTYYWRVDEVSGLNTVHGPVWSFTVTNNYTARDLYADTWVATDALGRALPGYDECGPPRENRYVALFYFLWLGEHSTTGPYDITKLLAANPTDPAWGPEGDYHHWGESELGYYLSSDDYVMRKHAHMLADAGVDVIVFDVTNGFTYQSNYLKLCSVFMDVRSEGGTTPQIAFMANGYGDNVAQNVYNNLYSQNLYPDLWFYWKGKPLILAPLDGTVVRGRTINHSQEVLDFFTMRDTWAWTAGYDIWNWIDNYPQQYGWHESSSIPEETSVCVGHHPMSNMGRSFSDGSQPSYDIYDLSGYEHLGLNFAEQWTRLNQIDPELIFITGWNEWVAQRNINDNPARLFLGQQLPVGESYFVDAYNQEYSRDIEPMKDGHTDNYYYQMIDGIRRYKGVRPPQSPSAAKTISIDGSFDDWDDVGPNFEDSVRDTTHRNEPGWGSAGTYVNNTGRNDFMTAKVAKDDTYIYFYIQTDDNITPYTDPGWMYLFINSDQDYSNGWEGYDYLISLASSSTTTTLRTTASGWNWTYVNTNISYRVSGNQMEIRVPRADIDQGSGSSPVAFDFHLADNMQAANIIEFSINGDSAPNRRANYRYEHYVVPPTILNASFEIPNISGYVYEPTGTSWSHSGGGFILADSGSAFGNTSYDGNQVMVMQNAVSAWQTLTGFEVGQTYTVSWAEADRPGSLGGNDLRVKIDSSIVGSLHTVNNDSWVVKTSSTFQATSTTHTLKFEALNSAGGDRSVFIDHVIISGAN